MAVKQKVVEVVVQPKEARLQILLRVLQGISAHDGVFDKYISQIVISLGTVSVPKEPEAYMKFVDDIKKVQSILAKECSDQKHIFLALKTLYDEISNTGPSKIASPAMSIVLQLINEDDIPNAVKYILNAGYPDQNLEKALYTLCMWLTKCAWIENLGPLILAFMKGLEDEQHYEILVEVAMATIEPLFRLLIIQGIRKSVGPVVYYMLSKNQQSPQLFHKVIPLTKLVCQHLDKERSELGHQYLQNIVNLFLALMEHFPGFPELYEPFQKILQNYYSNSNYKNTLRCKSWGDSPNSHIASRLVGKVGLNNLGNTCYMNSVLQALFMTRTFRNEVLLHNKNMLPLFSKLQVLFALLQHSVKFSLSPNDILNLSRPPGFLPGYQHDSSEFLGYLLDTLHEQEKNLIGNHVDTIEGPSSSTSLVIAPTVVQQSFGGRTITVSRCDECGTQSERADHFRELQLAFPNHSDNNQSVQTLLDYYLQPERLSGENQYRCDVCARLTDGERITRIVEAPARLILTLKHFRYDPASQQRTKLLQVVKLDQYLRLDHYRYELYAAVVHWGSSVDSGHYYTFARDKTDWYKFNDCSVTKTTPEDLCRLEPPETPYILFYSREDVEEPEPLPRAVLSDKLQIALSKDQSEHTNSKINGKKIMRSDNDDQPPPGCGGGGFSPSSGMFVC